MDILLLFILIVTGAFIGRWLFSDSEQSVFKVLFLLDNLLCVALGLWVGVLIYQEVLHGLL